MYSVWPLWPLHKRWDYEVPTPDPHLKDGREGCDDLALQVFDLFT